ncbi:MAG: PucR family transcriptional regulator ligand-binding domain-containing protein [Schumannella sp.]
MVTLVQLVAALGPALVPVNDAARHPVEVGGIHISELADPTPYLEGGEALLTTGFPFAGPGAVADAADYVARLLEHGVVALVIGLGPQLDEVPDALIQRCTEAGMPLLVVPADQLFVRVTRKYWDLVAATGRATLVAQLGTQTALAREAAKPDGIAGVVSLVAQAVGGWAAYIPLHGGEPVIWPATQAGVLPGLQTEVRRFAERGNVGAATFPLHGFDVIAHPVGSGAQVRGALAVGVGRRPAAADRQLILTATAVLGLRERAQGDAASIGRAIGEAVVNLLLAGEVTAAQALIETTGGGSLPATVRVFAFPLPGDHRQQVPATRLEAMISELAHRGIISAAAAERSGPPGRAP